MSDLNDSFLTESEKLETQINHLLNNSEKLTITDVVSVYYQIMNVNSMLQILKTESNLDENVSNVEKLVKKTFNESLHPKILSQLTASIQEYMAKLKENKGKERSQETIQKEAKLYEKLRELMSTKEFVEQYDKGLIK